MSRSKLSVTFCLIAALSLVPAIGWARTAPAGLPPGSPVPAGIQVEQQGRLVRIPIGDPEVRRATAEEIRRYAEREQQNIELQQYEGGIAVVLSVSLGAAVIIILLILLLAID